MALRTQASFAAGELDPALHKRTTLDKFQSGLATLRNAYIGKTGRIISRPATKFHFLPKYSDLKCVTFSPKFSPYLIEWGHQYVRIYDIPSGTFSEDTHDFVESDIPFLQFTPNGRWVYIARAGKKLKKMLLGPVDPLVPLYANRFLNDTLLFGNLYPNLLPGPSNPAYLVGSNATGRDVEYVATFVLKGEESIASGVVTGVKFVINVTESSFLRLNVQPNPDSAFITEVRWYRRPKGGNAFGYIGSATQSSIVGGDKVFDFTDYGVDADYAHSPPTLDFVPDGYPFGTLPTAWGRPRTVAIYQQKLITTETSNEEAIHASRTGYQNNFLRDYPLSDDSALTFKAGTSDNAKVLRFLDNNGLMVFTTVGIYVNSGALTPDNLALVKKAPYIIDDTIAPIDVPSAVLITDKLTDSVRALVYSNEAGGIDGEEISIFSDHLFKNRKKVSWAFQNGTTPLVWVVFDDGTLVSLTYQKEQQMQAWARHDTDGQVECVSSYTNAGESRIFMVVKRGNQRVIEYFNNRYEKDYKDLSLVDSGVTYKRDIGALAGGASFIIQAINVDNWDSDLSITSDFAAFTNTPNNGAVGSVWRFFDKSGSAIDLVVTAYLTSTQVIVTPDLEFPSDQGVGVKIFQTTNVVTGLSHLNGKLVSVLVDGNVEGSPNNNNENYTEYLVVGGSITLANDKRGAIIHVGLPFTVDIEPLDIDTVEQKPIGHESKIVGKLYLTTLNSDGLYVGSRFDENDKVKEMVAPDIQADDLILNAAQVPKSKEFEIVIPNDWKSNGRVCMRQVDPLPVEILSIVTDLEVPY